MTNDYVGISQPAAPTTGSVSGSGLTAWGPTEWSAIMLLVVGVVIWALSLSHVRLDDMTDIGLASALPASTWAGLGFVTAGAFVAWRSGSTPLMTAALLATVVTLHGIGVLGEPEMRFAQAWAHVGITDHVAGTGTVDPNIDAFFNWPGFFILGAFLTKVAGLHDVEPIARAAPLFLNVLYLAPLVVIGQALFEDRRVIWLGVWLFVVGNWIGQDYFSPQGMSFLLYLVMIAIVLRWFRREPAGPRAGPRWLRRPRAGLKRLTGNAAIVPQAPASRVQRAILVVVLVALVAVVAESHQLTPFAIVTATAGLVIVGWSWLYGLPVIAVLVTGLWVAYMAVTYLAGHVNLLTGDIGALDKTVGTSLGGRIHGSSGHELVVKARIGVTLLIWSVAGLGFVLAAWRGRLLAGLLVLAVSPFPLLVLQSYGGEALLRVALFSLPFMAFSAASLVAADVSVSMRRGLLGLLGALAVFLVGVFPLVRYGNERFESFSTDEVAAVHALYRLAPKGSSLYSPSGSVPWRYTRYADYYYYNSPIAVRNDELSTDLDADAERIADSAASAMARVPGGNAFLIITRSSVAETDLIGPWRRGTELRLWRFVERSPKFRVLYRNRDAIIVSLASQARRGS